MELDWHTDPDHSGYHYCPQCWPMVYQEICERHSWEKWNKSETPNGVYLAGSLDTDEQPNRQEIHMNKADLINAIATSCDMGKTQVEAVINALTETIVKTVANGDEISLPGLFKITSTQRAARTGRNPQTGEPLKIAAATIPKFKALKAFKDAVNK